MAETQQKARWISFGDLWTMLAGMMVLYTVWTQHQSSMANIERTQQMLAKYETQLDLAIADDGNVLKTYQKNLRAITASMSKEEKALLTQLLSVESSMAGTSL